MIKYLIINLVKYLFIYRRKVEGRREYDIKLINIF